MTKRAVSRGTEANKRWSSRLRTSTVSLTQNGGRVVLDRRCPDHGLRPGPTSKDLLGADQRGQTLTVQHPILPESSD